MLDTKSGIIRRAALIALFGNILLACIKLCGGIIWNSAGLLGDGIDTSADVLIAVVTLFVAKRMRTPADKEHPWGHGRTETIASALLSFLMIFSGVQLIFSAGKSLVAGEAGDAPALLTFVVAGISIIGKLLLAWSQFALSKRSGSAILKANAKNFSGDVLISASVATGLLMSILFHTSVPDTAISMLIGIWIIFTAVGIFREANIELMDGGASAQHYNTLFSAVKAVEGAKNPHRARMRRIAGFWDIDIDLEVDPALTVEEAHRIASRVEDEIKKSMDNIYDIVVHIEPLNDSADNEGFGLIDESGADANEKDSPT